MEGRFNGGFLGLRVWRTYIWSGFYMEGLMAMKNSKIVIQKRVVVTSSGCLQEVSTVVISMGKFWWSLMGGVTHGRSTIII